MSNFDISKGVKVTISAKKRKTFHRTDLKVKIKGSGMNEFIFTFYQKINGECRANSAEEALER